MSCSQRIEIEAEEKIIEFIVEFDYSESEYPAVAGTPEFCFEGSPGGYEITALYAVSNQLGIEHYYSCDDLIAELRTAIIEKLEELRIESHDD